jgi:hypothetical protein
MFKVNQNTLYAYCMVCTLTQNYHLFTKQDTCFQCAYFLQHVFFIQFHKYSLNQTQSLIFSSHFSLYTHIYFVKIQFADNFHQENYFSAHKKGWTLFVWSHCTPFTVLLVYCIPLEFQFIRDFRCFLYDFLQIFTSFPSIPPWDASL